MRGLTRIRFSRRRSQVKAKLILEDSPFCFSAVVLNSKGSLREPKRLPFGEYRKDEAFLGEKRASASLTGYYSAGEGAKSFRSIVSAIAW